MALNDDTPTALTRSLGRATQDFADVFEDLAPDLLLVLGDRYELLAPVQAALIRGLPIAHIGGGEETLGAIDNAIRNAITMMADVHFVAAKDYHDRLLAMGKLEGSVHFVGSLGVENTSLVTLKPFAELQAELGLAAGRPLFLTTYHPVTRQPDRSLVGLDAMLAALDRFPEASIIFTGVNADPDHGQIDRRIRDYAGYNSGRVHFADSLGLVNYLSVMAEADAVIGNSSSGIFEAPPFKTPSINIGSRQDGRIKAASVIDCAEDPDAIEAALSKALSDSFLGEMKNMELPFPGDDVAGKILEILRSQLRFNP
jgi:UDP-hydrolysing UDP-N-acetyl-D-glucosamine 2-epimerase